MCGVCESCRRKSVEVGLFVRQDFGAESSPALAIHLPCRMAVTHVLIHDLAASNTMARRYIQQYEVDRSTRCLRRSLIAIFGLDLEPFPSSLTTA